MPELPEAETIVRGLRRPVAGREIVRVEVVRPDVLREPPGAFRRRLRSRRIEGVGRRGKNVVLLLSGDHRLVVNLGMTGRLLPFSGPASPGGGGDPEESRHPAVRLLFDGGGGLVFDDTRRFGSAECLDAAGWRAFDERLGLEPLSRRFTARRLREMLSSSRAPLRSWLLDQNRIAGVGNIYAVEALWKARLHPALPARRVDVPAARRLHRALRKVLREAIEARGTTLRDYRDAEGAPGNFAPRLAVYGREGELCPRCGTAVERLVFAGRSAYLCPRCQPGAEGGDA